jgi:hypothetical protein
MLRPVQLHLKVTEAEKQKFEALAVSRHMTLSELVRQTLHREADNHKSKAAA